MFGLEHSLQLVVLYKSVGAGFLTGAYYSVFMTLRSLGLNKRAQVFVQDLLFFAGAGAGVFLFMLDFSPGGVRGYALFGEAAGFLLFYLLVSPFAVAAGRRAAKRFSRFFAPLKRACAVRKTRRRQNRELRRSEREKRRKKISKICKKHLRKSACM